MLITILFWLFAGRLEKSIKAIQARERNLLTFKCNKP
jgi:hypothetical protein